MGMTNSMNENALVGVSLGNYTIERIIGKGGMAIVFLAQQARPTRTVAVKVLLPSAAENDPEERQVFLERFRREANTIAKLEHKNILPIYEYEEAIINNQHLAYLVMPYVRGGTLRQHIDELKYRGQKADLQTILNFISQIAEALSYAHSLGIVHRDVKPSNLLFHSDGRLLLSDFGIAHLSAMPSLTLVGSFIGTAEYASPEQVSTGEVDSRSDIYSLGIILYELLVGSVPFTGPTPFAVMSQHLHDPVPSVRTLRPDLSPALEFVVKKALAKSPKDRYQSANELASDLRAAITPAVALPNGLRLDGDGRGNNDLTVADNSWQPPAARATGATVPIPGIAHGRPAPAQPVEKLPVTAPATPAIQSPLPLPGNAVWQGGLSPQQVMQTPNAVAQPQGKTYRSTRRLTVLIIGPIMMLFQFLVLGLLLKHNNQSVGTSNASIDLGILLGNMLNLLALAGIAFIASTRQRSIRNILTRVLWTTLLALALSGFFISFGQFEPTNLPLISYGILLLTNIFAIRELSKADRSGEQVEVAPISWQSALVGALTGLLPLLIILTFALIVPLNWASGDSFFLRLLDILVIGFIGAPTPGAMMAVWLSHKMSFPVLARTSALAGLLMFVAAYVLIIGASWLITGKPLFTDEFGQPSLLPSLILGGLLSLIGFLRGILDSWVLKLISKNHAIH